MPLEQFRSLTRNFIKTFLDVFYENGKDTLLLNHFFTDHEFDIDRCNSYLPNVRIIALYRDPRDVYYYACKKNVEWIAHESVEQFVRWCKITYKKFDIEAKEYFPLRFEDLVLKYDETVQLLEEFIGLKSEDHIHRREYLNPDVSKNNIGIWKSDVKLKDDMVYIERELSYLCYNG
jgi:hypothetical protein